MVSTKTQHYKPHKGRIYCRTVILAYISLSEMYVNERTMYNTEIIQIRWKLKLRL